MSRVCCVTSQKSFGDYCVKSQIFPVIIVSRVKKVLVIKKKVPAQRKYQQKKVSGHIKFQYQMSLELR